MNTEQTRYALAKQLDTAHTLSTNYGDVPLDYEMQQAVAGALRPILELSLRDSLCELMASLRPGLEKASPELREEAGQMLLAYARDPAQTDKLADALQELIPAANPAQGGEV